MDSVNQWGQFILAAALQLGCLESLLPTWSDLYNYTVLWNVKEKSELFV